MTTAQVSVAQAKQHFSDLLGRVAYGKEHITITRRGKPMVILVPIDRGRRTSHLADARGWLEKDDPFFATMERIVNERLTHRPRRPARAR